MRSAIFIKQRKTLAYREGVEYISQSYIPI